MSKRVLIPFRHAKKVTAYAEAARAGGAEPVTGSVENTLSLFGICRGLQILNVYHGGTLVQHLAATARHDPEKDDHSGPAHEVAFVAESKLAQMAAATTWQVNSRHHQAVLKLGLNLYVSARDSEDGTVEGIERRDRRFVAAVQWHPEDQTKKHPEQLRLFEGFAAAL
jgi:putative glutamine amidotransferase